jgi:hypothetical protein
VNRKKAESTTAGGGGSSVVVNLIPEKIVGFLNKMEKLFFS